VESDVAAAERRTGAGDGGWSRVHADFATGNQFSTRGDCAICTGTFGLTGNTLATGPLVGRTLIACPETAFDSRYKALLAGNTTVALSATTLELSSLRGVLRFKR
jgi:heat shock protein HslJ